jgi:hypothetical protein
MTEFLVGSWCRFRTKATNVGWLVITGVELHMGAGDWERWALPPDKEGAWTMCDQCRKIEVKIAHYREVASYVMDKPTLDSIDVLVARLEDEKKDCIRRHSYS